MGRRPTIDRDKVLDIAESLLLGAGTGALTIDAVAKAAGISKGGVQSCFGSKDDLIGALIERWGREYDAKVARVSGSEPTALEAIRGHVEVTMDLDNESYARAAGMMAALIEAKAHIAEARAWYEERLGRLDHGTDAGRRARIAFLATEGAFILRAYGFMKFADGEWGSIHDDLRALLQGKL